MKSNSASALTWLATILLVLGGLIMSSAGSFLTYILAVIFAAIPAVFDRGITRIVAFILLIIYILPAIGQYPQFQTERTLREKYRKAKQIKTTLFFISPDIYCNRF